MDELSLAYAQQCDADDSLRHYRDAFFVPERLYFCGHSLGLQPKKTKEYIQQELDSWASFGVRGHFENTRWYDYHSQVSGSLARLVGAHEHEVIAMNALSVNLHLLMISFFRPTEKRFKILIEKNVFASDRYAVMSQLQHRGLDPKDALIEVPLDANFCLDEDALLKILEVQGDDIAMVLLSGVNFLSGQVVNMQHITQAAHAKGCKVGFDLAHGVGNIPLQLHDWDVDFAAWCHYKYVNGGPGTIAGAYIHERHVKNKDLVRLTGWWGNDASQRFKMTHDFEPVLTAESWQISNPPIFQLAALRASLALFDEVGLTALREKSIKLTDYLETLMHHLLKDKVTILTPAQSTQRGAQLSLRILNANDNLVHKLSDAGIDVDFRSPDVIRMAPVPFYTRYVDVYECVSKLSQIL